MSEFTLAALAKAGNVELRPGASSPEATVDGVCSLTPGQPGRLAFADTDTSLDVIAATRAGVVVLSAEKAQHCGQAALVCHAPRRTYAHLARLFEPPCPPPSQHPAACVAETAELATDVALGAGCVVGAASRVGASCRIGANAVIDHDVVLAERVTIGPGAVVGARTRIGPDTTVEANAVIGARGFGLIQTENGFEEVPQLGGVSIGCGVEIGANTAIDRGSIDDTVICDGVKIDNLVQIAHNCRIGRHTVIAGCVGIAGSVSIGEFCMIGGGAGIADHRRIADHTVITAATQVARDIDEPGVFSSGLWAMPAAAWGRCLSVLRNLDQVEKRLRRLERDRRGTKE